MKLAYEILWVLESFSVESVTELNHVDIEPCVRLEADLSCVRQEFVLTCVEQLLLVLDAFQELHKWMSL